MPFQCPQDPTHESTEHDRCSICGGTSDAETPSIAVSVKKKGPTNTPRVCWNCGLDWKAETLSCANCGCEYVPGDIDMSPPGVESGQTPPTAATAAILEKVLRHKQGVGSTPPVLRAILSVDLSRRDCRPVDEKPPTDQTPRAFAMDQDTLPFGRSSDWMEINDAGVSRNHGEFVRQPDGSYCLRDVGSANGTHIDDKPLAPGDLRKVKVGDEIIVGFWHRITIQWPEN